ncbi:hypothetical protein SAMN02949497_3917 [Methylomagnum ishizawai]|uniref:Uncharacterized protein n=1 Tax=Methylomagnum ishizawai TaxID=1760988 RepID=A0A1Y6D1I8_9GAMM|nr:hypothetical protein [Methylomagnum ishizawai]SMF96517.1 hypothetical protein SAMN02949497_3917 [Methylomagnum ishizawai]
MNHVNSLIRLIDQGLSTQVMLNDGSMLPRFRPHDLIARGSPQTGVVVVRGTVCPDDGAPEDRVIPLCDICGVFSERPRQAHPADPAFLGRNPVPRGWTTLRARQG